MLLNLKFYFLLLFTNNKATDDSICFKTNEISNKKTNKYYAGFDCSKGKLKSVYKACIFLLIFGYIYMTVSMNTNFLLIIAHFTPFAFYMIRNYIDNKNCSFFESFDRKHSTRKSSVGFIVLLIIYSHIAEKLYSTSPVTSGNDDVNSNQN